MVKASDVIGRQITVRDGGQEVGRIKDLVVDPTGREVMGIVLSDGMFRLPGSPLESGAGLRSRLRGHRRRRAAWSRRRPSPISRPCSTRRPRSRGSSCSPTAERSWARSRTSCSTRRPATSAVTSSPADCSPMRSTGRPSCPLLSGSSWARMWPSWRRRSRRPSCRSAARGVRGPRRPRRPWLRRPSRRRRRGAPIRTSSSEKQIRRPAAGPGAGVRRGRAVGYFLTGVVVGGGRPGSSAPAGCRPYRR